MYAIPAISTLAQARAQKIFDILSAVADLTARKSVKSYPPVSPQHPYGMHAYME
jgi:hypothetical protein